MNLPKNIYQLTQRKQDYFDVTAVSVCGRLGDKPIGRQDYWEKDHWEKDDWATKYVLGDSSKDDWATTIYYLIYIKLFPDFCITLL